MDVRPKEGADLPGAPGADLPRAPGAACSVSLGRPGKHRWRGGGEAGVGLARCASAQTPCGLGSSAPTCG